MKKYFLSFASSDLYRSLYRIQKQAINIGIYDKINISTELDLDNDFRTLFYEHLNIGSRGYGYWCWKPQIILQTLRNMKEGDILQYTDSGRHLNINGKDRLLEYFSITERSLSGILAFQTKKPEPPQKYDGRNLLDLKDFIWTKGDLLDYFNVRNREDIVNTPTIGATILFIKKCPNALNILKQWIEPIYHDFSLIDDSPSRSNNIGGFREHRHDQSILSIVCKLNNVETLSAYEYWYPSRNKKYEPDWHILKNFPIHAKRDKDLGAFINSKHLFIKIIEKINRIIWHFNQGDLFSSQQRLYNK